MTEYHKPKNILLGSHVARSLGKSKGRGTGRSIKGSTPPLEQKISVIKPARHEERR